MKKAIWILWPSFVAGGVATVLFFTAMDPEEFGLASRLAGYTVGFFIFWAVAAGSSAFTCFLQRRADEVNRRPKREDADAVC